MAPAEQSTQPIIPNKKPLNKKLIAIIITVIVVCIVAIIVIMILNNKSEPQAEYNNSETSSESNKKPNKDTVVRGFITSLNTILNQYLAKEQSTASLEQIYDQVLPVYKSSSKVAIPLEKSYGLKTSSDISSTLSKAISEEVISFLTKNEFKQYEEVELPSEQRQYFNKNNGILCNIIDGVPFAVACGHIDWITADNTALINTLAEAYKRVEGDYPIYISASKKNIKDSPFEPYQKLQVVLPGATGLFYRPSPTSDWVFFAATQNVLSCKKYESDAGARKAFQGEKCYDESTKETRKVTNGTTDTKSE